MRKLAAEGIGTQVHYLPVHRQPYYRDMSPAGTLPGADRYYARTLSLPLYPGMTDGDVMRVCAALPKVLGLS
jgi:dTDP-4-amino-4,6-dideoxygalactose transaminase